MAETRERLNSLILSAAELVELSNWADPIIEDWLNLVDNIAILADEVDVKNDIIKNTTHVITTPYEIKVDDEDIFFDTDAVGPMVANLLPGVDGRNYRLINTGVLNKDRVTLNPFGTEKLFGVAASEFIANQEKLLITFEEELGGWF